MPTAMTDVLDIAYDEHGDPAGPPVVLLHGFPYDPRAFDRVVTALPAHRVVVPSCAATARRGSSTRLFCAPDSRLRSALTSSS